jgi:hypothetical protein
LTAVVCELAFSHLFCAVIGKGRFGEVLRGWKKETHEVWRSSLLRVVQENADVLGTLAGSGDQKAVKGGKERCGTCHHPNLCSFVLFAMQMRLGWIEDRQSLIGAHYGRQ